LQSWKGVESNDAVKRESPETSFEASEKVAVSDLGEGE
jgi:hypothetical protein